MRAVHKLGRARDDLMSTVEKPVASVSENVSKLIEARRQSGFAGQRVECIGAADAPAYRTRRAADACCQNGRNTLVDHRYRAPSSNLSAQTAAPPRPIFGVLMALLFGLVGRVSEFAIYPFLFWHLDCSEQTGPLPDRPGFAFGLQVTRVVWGFMAGYFCVRWSRGTSLREPLALVALEIPFYFAIFIVFNNLTVGGVVWEQFPLVSHLLGILLHATTMLTGAYVALAAVRRAARESPGPGR